MSTYSSFARTSGFTAARVLRAATSQRLGREISPMNDGQKRLSLVEELPME